MSDFQVERSIFVRATPQTVWSFFEQAELFARWWGEGSTIRAEVGAPLLIRYPNGETASGEVREVVPQQRIVFSYGYDQPGKPIPPGGSLVQVTLHAQDDGTLVRLRHVVDSAALRDQHEPGWRYQLAVFAKLLCDTQHAGAARMVEQWFAAWNAEQDAERRRLLAACTREDLHFADGFGNVAGREELAQHIAAVRHFVPLSLAQAGPLRQALGTAIVDWELRDAQGRPQGRGSNVIELDAQGRIARVVGIPG